MRCNNQPVWMKAGVKDGHLRRRRDEMICENQIVKERQTRGEAPADKWRWFISRGRQRVERMRGGGCVSRGQEVAAAWQQGWHDNQLANKRPMGREAFTDKRRWIVDRMRSNSGATRGVVTISWRHQRIRGGGIYKASGTLKWWELEVAQQEDERMRRRIVKMTGGGGCSATRDNTTTSLGKLERWIRGGHTGWQLADKRWRRRVTFTKQWNVCLTKFALLDFML
jgi:hypothetical protein